MSRIGKRPVVIPDGVQVTLTKEQVTVKGPNGTLEQQIPPHVEVVQEDKNLVVKPASKVRNVTAFQGLAQSLIQNAVTGVTKGFEKKLQIEGVGYRVNLQGNKLVFNLGYSNPTEFELPKGIKADLVDKGLEFTIKGADKQLVGQTAAKIRALRAPEPYKGKGIRYADEHIRRKAGKAGVK